MIILFAGFRKGKYITCILAWTLYASVHVVINVTHLGGLKKVRKLIKARERNR